MSDPLSDANNQGATKDSKAGSKTDSKTDSTTLPNTASLIRRIAGIGWPILIAQLAMIANSLIDTAMTGRYSSNDLAALAIGSATFASISVGLSGVVQALMPVVAQIFGRGDVSGIRAELRQGLWLALFLSAPGCLILCFPHPILTIAHATPELTVTAVAYLRWLACALPAFLLFRVYTSFVTAIGQTKSIMMLQIGGLVTKCLLNEWLIFGGLGLPAMGGPGCGLATAFTIWAIVLIAYFYARYSQAFTRFELFAPGTRLPRWTAQKELLKIGIPMGFGYLIEVTAFTFMAVFIARLGSIAVGGHQIAASFGAMMYMLPLSLANATSTLVAQAVGGGSPLLARKTGRVGLLLACSSAGLFGLIVWLCRASIIALFTNEPLVAAAAMPLFAFISFYQIFDAAQVTAIYILRAYRITLMPTVLYAIFLWIIGVGSGILMGFNIGGWTPEILRGASGFWMGNSASLALVAAAMLLYLRHIQQRQKK